MPFSQEEREMPEFISPLLWPPNSPDLNPVHDITRKRIRALLGKKKTTACGLWSVLQEKVYKTRITDLDDLKHHIRTEWRRLSACVRAGGGHFEHCF